MTKINPYLTLNGHSTEAMNFYHQCLGGNLSLMKVKDSPMASQWPKESQEMVLHGSLIHTSFTLLCSDVGDPNSKMIKGNTLSLSIECETEGELHQQFNSLSAGGKVHRELHEFFGGTIGALTDQFGIDWIFYHNKNK